MHILMIAPEPFFEPRGTPFSEYHRIRALLDLGHTVDLVTYPFGKDVALPGLRIFRAARPPFIRHVKIGPSAAKALLDLTLTLTALNRARQERYDAVHSHEEGAAIGLVISAALRIPHVYDMHSSLPQQLENFEFSRSAVLRWVFQTLERTAIRRSRVTIVICPHLQETAKNVVPGARTILIENAPGSGDAPVEGSGRAIRAGLGLDASTPIVLYTGTFEAYQGLDLLFAAAKAVNRERPDVRFVLAGGKPEQVAKAKARASALGAAGVIFTGEQPPELIPGYLDAADVLVSPRSSGTNTPLKIYQYLRSGRVIVATRLLTHTQVLSDEVAILTEPTPEDFARGVLRAVTDPTDARRIGEEAKRLANTVYTYDAYLQRTREACAVMGSDPMSKNVTGSDPMHYSYAAYSDPSMAASFDAKRFGGPIGRILLEDQERVLAEFLRDVAGRRILDLGTGTGRAAIALARRGALVTGVDASNEMLSVARTRSTDLGLSIQFTEGDAHALAFSDRAFDSAVCLRLLMHVPDWRKALSELCRVTERRLVFDYPAFGSSASLQAAWRRATSHMGLKVESYRVFRAGAIARELARHGFRIAASHKQFVLPIAFHKLVGSAGVTRSLEGLLASAGMLRLAGSPVTIAAERCES